MDRADQIGTLCVAGDWACVHGDLPGLAEIATTLAALFDDPLALALLGFADECRRDPRGAVARWTPLRERLFDEGARPSP